MRRLPSRRDRKGVPGLLLWLAVASASTAHAEGQAAHQPRGTVTAIRAAQAPAIDGRLSEEMWVLAVPASGFTQTDPDEGQPATERRGAGAVRQ